MCQKWSELSYSGVYATSNESSQAVLGYCLVAMGIDLEKLPNNLFEPFDFYPSKELGVKNRTKLQKVNLNDIVGTSYKEYAEDNRLLYSFMRLKRITKYIQNNSVTRNKYFRNLKRRQQDNYVTLSRNSDGTFFVDGNGNHRIIAYKIMMLAEVAQNYNWVYEDDYDLSFKGFEDITKKYWLYAMVNQVD